MELILAGDLMLARGVSDMIRRNGMDYPLQALYPVLRAADGVFANLECALAEPGLSYSGPPKAFYFRADPDTVEVLRHARVDLVSLANNHALDAGVEGLRQTLDILGEHGIQAVGAGNNLAEASRMVVSAIGDVRIGVLAYCDHQADFAADHDKPGIRYLDLRQPESRNAVLEEIRDHTGQVDHLIVSMHWQSNWEPRVRQAFRDLARAMMDAGASLVWGHSPHHIQGVEWFPGGPAIYGSGSLLDDYAIDPGMRNDLHVLYRVRIASERVARVEALPIKLELGRSTPAQDEDRAAIQLRLSAFCRSLDTAVREDGTWLEIIPAAPEAP